MLQKTSYHKRAPTNYVHPLDVLRVLDQSNKTGLTCALVIVTGTEGGGLRAPGAFIAVTGDGECAGYVSNGCVDGDLIIQSLQAIKDGKVRQVRYGAGSPYKDIQLPCGGGVDVMILPHPDPDIIAQTVTRLEARQRVDMIVRKNGSITYSQAPLATGWQEDNFHIVCLPKIRFRIAGRGAEPMALTCLALASDFEVILQSPDEVALEKAEALGAEVEHLLTPSSVPDADDDQWTAFVLLFHDHDWEGVLLKEALRGNAFYIGALGSPQTHGNRCENLRNMDVPEMQIARIHAPIGLIPSLRDASVLAISILAEIVQKFNSQRV